MIGSTPGFNGAATRTSRIAAAAMLAHLELILGNEKFLASLALALGLVELTPLVFGRLDAPFLDEGFGSLDATALDAALANSRRASGGKLVGIITRVRGVASEIDDVLRVRRLPGGNEVEPLDAAEREHFFDDAMAAGLLEAVTGIVQRLRIAHYTPPRTSRGSRGSRFYDYVVEAGLELGVEIRRKRLERQIRLDRRLETRAIIGFVEDRLPIRLQRRHFFERAFDSSCVFGDRSRPRIRALLRLKSIFEEMHQHDRKVGFEPSTLTAAQCVELVRELVNVERLPAMVSQGASLFFTPSREVSWSGARLRTNTSGHDPCCNIFIFTWRASRVRSRDIGATEQRQNHGNDRARARARCNSHASTGRTSRETPRRSLSEQRAAWSVREETALSAARSKAPCPSSVNQGRREVRRARRMTVQAERTTEYPA